MGEAGAVTTRLVSQVRASAGGSSILWRAALTVDGVAVDGVGAGTTGSAAVALVTGGAASPSYSMLSTNFRAHGGGEFTISATVDDGTERFRALLRNDEVIARGLVGVDGFAGLGLNQRGTVAYVHTRGTAPDVALSLHRYRAADDVQTLGESGAALGIPGSPIWSGDSFGIERVFVGGDDHTLVNAVLEGAPPGADEVLLLFDPATATPRVVVREGDPAPELDGVAFGRLYRPGSPALISTNTVAVGEGGDVIAHVELTGSGVTASTNDSLWKYDGAAERGSRSVALRTC
jgi:hypothetical protein